MSGILEAYARQKWCPFVRQGFHNGDGNPGAVSINRDVRADQNDFKCIGNDCMMWKTYVNRRTAAETGDCGLKV